MEDIPSLGNSGAPSFPFFVVGPSQFPPVGATFPPYGSSRTLCTSFHPLTLSIRDYFNLPHRKKRHSALKIIKSAGRYSETARDEIKLLRQITNASPSHPGRAYMVSFLDSFTHTLSSTAHICITFEPLGANLLSLIEKNRRKGVPPCVVKSIAKQVLLGLQYLHDECDLVHTDIKPENISQSHVAALLQTRV